MELEVLIGLGMGLLTISSILFIVAKELGFLKQKIKPRKSSNRRSYRRDK